MWNQRMKNKSLPKLSILVSFSPLVSFPFLRRSCCCCGSNKIVLERLLAQRNKSQAPNDCDIKMFHLSHAIRTYTCWPEPHCLFALYQPVISAMIVVKRNGIVVICLWGEDGNVRMNIKCDTFLNMTIDQLYFWYPTLRRSLSQSQYIYILHIYTIARVRRYNQTT